MADGWLSYTFIFPPVVGKSEISVRIAKNLFFMTLKTGDSLHPRTNFSGRQGKSP
jgi:gluconate kinase